ncbi:MAG: hypothetical protein ABSG02_20910 [Terriglobales bacterium]|jgi:hypothetical protein
MKIYRTVILLLGIVALVVLPVVVTAQTSIAVGGSAASTFDLSPPSASPQPGLTYPY